jgi:hypothetical protein
VATRYVKGQHGGLPNIPAVAQEVLAWLTRNKLKLAETCQGALSGHLSAEDEATAVPLLDGSGVGSRFHFDMYDANEWKLDLDAAAIVHLQNVLDEVRQFYRRSELTAWGLATWREGNEPEDMGLGLELRPISPLSV